MTMQDTSGRAEKKTSHGKLLTAGLICSSIEWYDFFIYGTAAALVFDKVFFPNLSPFMGTLMAFATFSIGFIARPVGGILAGHYGDKIGRKPMLIWCLVAMGVATFLIGCLPTANTIGVAAPLLLVTCRFVQGLACGGQWGGVVLLLTESAGPKRRGFAGTFGQMGVPIGVVTGNLMLIFMNGILSDQAFLSWGWRVPFWASAVLVPVVLYVHNRVEDSPEFLELQREVAKKNEGKAQVAAAPLSEAIRGHWRTILMAGGLLFGTNTAFYVTIAGFVSYGSKPVGDGGLGMASTSVLLCVLIVCAIQPFTLAWTGSVSDRIGRRPLVLVGGAVLVFWGFPFFWLADTKSVGLLLVAMAISTFGQALTYGPVAAFMAELFEPRIRYSGASLAYQFAAVGASALAPIIMTAIIAKTGSSVGVSIYLAVMGAVTFASAYFLPETNPKSVRDDPAALPGLPACA